MQSNHLIRLMILLTLGYFIAGSAVVLWFRPDPGALILELFTMSAMAPTLLVRTGTLVLAPAILALLLLVPRREILARLPAAVVLLFLCTFFFFTFTLVKTTLPFAVPFRFDPLFADLDARLFGTDPWRLTHGLMPWLGGDFATRIYNGFWLMPAMFLPVLAQLFDPDPARGRRFLLLYAFVWIVLGNLLAYAFSSAGPVYYFELTGDPRFAPLTGALLAQGAASENLVALQAWLWSAYQTEGQRIGSGISAFPSVHVGMVMVLALYMTELRRGLWPLGVLLVAAYLFLSVHLAWHYAVDGIASILLVIPAWWLLRRRQRQQQTG